MDPNAHFLRDYILMAVLAYLCGSIPFGYILVKLFKKQDIRTTGSGNIGATNVARTAPLLGVATLILDAAKGFLPVYFLLPHLWPRAGESHLVQWEFGHSLIELSLVLLFVVLGHMFPIWLRFRGGKGVATAVGALAPLEPRAVLGAVIVFAIVLVLARYVSLASIAAAAVFPFFATNTSRYPAFWPFRHQIPLLCAYGVISALIILKHHANIRRLLNGTENKFGGKKKLEAVVKED